MSGGSVWESLNFSDSSMSSLLRQYPKEIGPFEVKKCPILKSPLFSHQRKAKMFISGGIRGCGRSVRGASVERSVEFVCVFCRIVLRSERKCELR